MPAKMQAIADQIHINAPYVRIDCNDNIMSSVWVHVSLDDKSTWNNGIYENSRYMNFSIMPFANQRYYSGGKVTIECRQSYKLPGKFRKCTATPEKCIEKMLQYIAKQGEYRAMEKG